MAEGGYKTVPESVESNFEYCIFNFIGNISKTPCRMYTIVVYVIIIIFIAHVCTVVIFFLQIRRVCATAVAMSAVVSHCCIQMEIRAEIRL